jgi:AraC-like DNA-binding protein
MIIPDGCQDLLYWVVPGMRPRWTVSHLQAGVMAVRIPQGATIVGFRFAPGTELPERVRSELMERPGDDPDHTLDAVMESIGYDQRVAESLAAVAELGTGVEDAARSLGVSRRTLERLLARHTGRAPVFWSQLARVRAAARVLVSGGDPPETAYETGYADQAHLSRSVRRWFGVSPTELLSRDDLTAQLMVPGYDAPTGEQISTR